MRGHFAAFCIDLGSFCCVNTQCSHSSSVRKLPVERSSHPATVRADLGGKAQRGYRVGLGGTRGKVRG